ncbi:MAG: hypothetical protein PHX07_03410 [Candidatus Marinimicrobia bacterium]|jgi:hypothetical protein|nr:hypothetical protein [Candidatus Neomarinimicrobiota bacterium]MDD5709293.1 hypothetical protein [Candidatus Neomarinimicrobiota bacterium]MDX9777555.1 hypothetical protein [bacterium]
MKKIVLSVLIILSFTGLIFAQDISNVENYRIYKMSEFLDLTPEQAEVFFPLLRQYEKEIAGIAEQENRLYESIKDRAKKNQISDEDLKGIMEQVNRFEQQRAQLKTQFMNRSGQVLSPGQVTRMQFFEKEFRKDLKREFIQQRANPNAGKNNPGNRPGQGSGNNGGTNPGHRP